MHAARHAVHGGAMHACTHMQAFFGLVAQVGREVGAHDDAVEEDRHDAAQHGHVRQRVRDVRQQHRDAQLKGRARLAAEEPAVRGGARSSGAAASMCAGVSVNDVQAAEAGGGWRWRRGVAGAWGVWSLGEMQDRRMQRE